MKMPSFFSSVIIVSILSFSVVNCGPTKAKDKIFITTPSVGNKWLAGDTVAITWNQPVANPTITYTYTKGTLGWLPLSYINKVSDQKVLVIVPVRWFSDSVQLKIEDPSGTYETNTSDFFSINYIRITSPQQNQTLLQNQDVTISWKGYKDKLISFVIMLSTSGAIGTFKPIHSTNSIPLADSTYLWKIGSETGATFTYPSQNCVLKIVDYRDETIQDMVKLNIQ